MPLNARLADAEGEKGGLGQGGRSRQPGSRTEPVFDFKGECREQQDDCRIGEQFFRHDNSSVV